MLHATCTFHCFSDLCVCMLLFILLRFYAIHLHSIMPHAYKIIAQCRTVQETSIKKCPLFCFQNYLFVVVFGSVLVHLHQIRPCTVIIRPVHTYVSSKQTAFTLFVFLKSELSPTAPKYGPGTFYVHPIDVGASSKPKTFAPHCAHRVWVWLKWT